MTYPQKLITKEKMPGNLKPSTMKEIRMNGKETMLSDFRLFQNFESIQK
jgi:hypothetical protein